VTKKWVRALYRIRARLLFRHAALAEGGAGEEYWQAGRSVAGIRSVRPVAEIVREMEEAVRG
jgi:hypothetical protein